MLANLLEHLLNMAQNDFIANVRAPLRLALYDAMVNETPTLKRPLRASSYRDARARGGIVGAKFCASVPCKMNEWTDCLRLLDRMDMPEGMHT